MFQVNSLNQGVIDDFNKILQEVESNPAIEATVIISGKPDCFIAGADITMLEKCKTKEEVLNIAKTGKFIYPFMSYLECQHL